MIRKAWFWAAMALAALAGMSGSALAQEPENLTYEVREGDTLIGLARLYLVDEREWRQVQRLNAVRNPRKMPIGLSLKMPRSLLRYDDVGLQVAAFSGPVEVGGAQAAVGAALGEGQIISTGPDGFVTLRSTFGGRVSLPSNSSARLVRARRYVLGGTLSVDFAIERGRGAVFSPTLEGEDELLLSTPRAVTAVRGTEFRVAYDPEADRSVTEVTEGVVAVGLTGGEITATQGFAVASTAAGLTGAEALLATPDLIDPSAIQLDETLDFALNPAPLASAHRFQIARDASFIDVIGAQVIEGDNATFASLENGRYYVRARAISESGIEGFSDSYTFRRRRVGIAASSEPADLVDGYLFRWLPQGEQGARFAFQLWRDGDRSSMLIDETGMSSKAIVLTDIEPGVYQWRVAAVVPDEEGLLKVWGPDERLTISE